MTIVPPSADDALIHLRAQVDDLTQELAAAAADDGGVSLKQRIFLLHRSLEQHAQVIEQAQRDVRGLVDGWKERFSESATAPARSTPVESQALAASLLARTVTPSSPVASTILDTAATAQQVAVLARPTPATELHAPHAAEPRPTASPRTLAGGAVSGQPRVIDELNASTFVERGWSRIATADFVGAEEALEKALELNPGDPHAETLLGWARRSQGHFDSAMALFQQVLDRVPDHALAHVNVGFVHLRRGSFALSRESLDRAVTLDSDRKATLYAHFYRGLLHFAQEDFAEAIGSFLRAIELGPNLIEARYELGRALWFADRTDDAIAAWRKGAELNKFNAWSGRCREMLGTIAEGGAPLRVG